MLRAERVAAHLATPKCRCYSPPMLPVTTAALRSEPEPPPAMRRKLKILHTMTWLAPGGGADQNVLLTVQNTVNDYEVHFAVGPNIHQNQFIEVPGLTFMICPHMVRPIHPIKDLMALWWFVRLIRAEKYDVVHTHETKASLITRVAAWLARCPFIIYGLHGVAFNDPLSRLKRTFYILAEKWTIGAADLIVAVSKSTVEEYHQARIGLDIPYEVIYSGVDVTRFEAQAALARRKRVELRRALGIGPGEFVIVNVGRFSYSKGQRYTIEAFAKLAPRHSRLRLLFIGEGELKEDCMRQAEALGVGRETIFAGFRENVPEAVSVADLLLLTSLREGLPRAAVEAYLCGLPVVSFEVEGIHEVIEDGVTGYVVPQYDVNALAERTERLVVDDAQRLGFAAKGGERVRVTWDHRHMVASLKRIYDTRLTRA